MKCPGDLKDINALLNHMQSACPVACVPVHPRSESTTRVDWNTGYLSWRSQGHECYTSLYLKKCPGDRKDKNVLRYYNLKNVLEISRT